tara:strand:+ start:40 stop:273 length:234 start_codon:yes stop_codon:yes gene_type:complete
MEGRKSSTAINKILGRLFAGTCRTALPSKNKDKTNRTITEQIVGYLDRLGKQFGLMPDKCDFDLNDYENSKRLLSNR